jgi:regulatory protein SWI6
LFPLRVARHALTTKKIAITHLIAETTSLFQGELKTKQSSIDSLHASLRTTSAHVGEARRALEAMQEKMKEQQLARQKILNLSAAVEEEEYRLVQLEQTHGRLNVDSVVAWEAALDAALSPAAGPVTGAALPSTSALRARMAAVRSRSEETKRATGGLKARSKELELKYRHLVSLCTGRSDTEVDVLVDGLTRAVESERGELEIARVRRFLGGVEGVVQ